LLSANPSIMNSNGECHCEHPKGAKQSHSQRRDCFVSLAMTFLITWSAFILILYSSCLALTPEEVVVIANKMAEDSVDLAEYYMKKRGVPAHNLIKLKAPSDEHCNREDYEKYIASPIREFLKKNDPGGNRFKCLLIMYGVPLKVGAPKLTNHEQKQLQELRKQLDITHEKIKKSENQDKMKIETLKKEEEGIKKQIDDISKAFEGASVDSELAIVREDNYPLKGWLPNKYFVGYRREKVKNMPEKVMLISRLDGPSEDIVRRIIEDSLQTEEKGLYGNAYFDARWPDPGDKKVTDYAFYDRAIHNAAHLVEKRLLMPTILDSQERLFQPKSAPDAALYCGWYSLANYVDAFTWVRGSVGFHIASSECSTLKNKGSKVWCKAMLEKGVAATLGPVSEPYIQSFPVPDVFFGCLVEGQMTLAECYALSNPFWSWQMLLIGDPLYQPFKNYKKKKNSQV